MTNLFVLSKKLTAVKLVTTVLNKLLTKVLDLVYCKHKIKIFEPARHLNTVDRGNQKHQIERCGAEFIHKSECLRKRNGSAVIPGLQQSLLYSSISNGAAILVEIN